MRCTRHVRLSRAKSKRAGYPRCRRYRWLSTAYDLTGSAAEAVLAHGCCLPGYAPNFLEASPRMASGKDALTPVPCLGNSGSWSRALGRGCDHDQNRPARGDVHRSRNAATQADPVPEELITKVLDAAIRAPSGGNTQNWIFIVVREEAQRRLLAAVYRKARMRLPRSTPPEDGRPI